MITSLIVITMIASILMAGITNDYGKGQLEVVDFVGLSRYVGRWYDKLKVTFFWPFYGDYNQSRNRS